MNAEPALTANVAAWDDDLLALIRKYDRPGPRYTSFPPANHFREVAADIPADEAMGPPTAADKPLSLYVHVPFCETLCWFCGCHTITTLNRDLADRYLDLLESEMALHAARLGPRRTVGQLHLGGGTPNFLTPAQIDRLGGALQRHFTLAEDAEVSVELDPRRLTADHVAAFRRLGVNRASFGVQDSNPDVQQAIHRIQPPEANAAAMQLLRDAGIASVNVDLIYGLPLQTVASFRETLAEVLALGPERFAVFNYAHVPWMKPAQKLLDRHPRPTPETKLQLLRTVIETLQTAGYRYIGMDHFARPDDELVRARESGTLQRNFQGYSTRRGMDILGLGISAISQTTGHYFQNAKDLPAYENALSAGRFPLLRSYALNADDYCRRRAIMQLMCNLHLPFADYPGPQKQPFTEYFADTLNQLGPMADDGLVHLLPDALRVTPRGLFFLRNLAMTFDPYLSDTPNRYSRTV